MKRSIAIERLCGGRFVKVGLRMLFFSTLIFIGILAVLPRTAVHAKYRTQEENASEIWGYQTESEVLKGSDPAYIFIGDSRTVGMSAYVGANDYIWSAKNGVGLDWMKKSGVPAIEGRIEKGSNIICLMGFNDIFFPDMTRDYTDYLNKKAVSWTEKGASVYYVSVNPITREEVAGGEITNEKIIAWNEDIRKNLSARVTYIDTFSMTD